MDEIKLTTLRKTPVLYVDSADAEYSRICGATFNKLTNQWLFPATPPFLHNVLYDLEKVYSSNVLHTDAQQWVDACGTLDGWREIVRNLDLPTKSYRHQLEGTAELLYYYRWILKWEMGTGKTKTTIDALSYLRGKTLVLCPLIAVNTWVKEVALHSAGQLSVLGLQGQSTNTKRNIIRRAVEEDYDVLVATYDITRTMGRPYIAGKVREYCKKHHLTLHQGLLHPLKQISTANKQLELVQDWHLRDRPPKDIRQEIGEIVKATPYQWLTDFNYDTIVGDESHRVKNYKSLRTKACLDLAKEARRRILLTGTLTQGDPWDLYPQLKFLAPHIMPEDTLEYKAKYFETSPYNDRIVTGYKNLHILNQRVSAISSTQKLSDCVSLPPRTFIVQKYDLSKAQKAGYNQIVKSWTLDRPDASPLEMANGAVRIAKLLQICSGFVYTPVDDEICDNCNYVRKCVLKHILPGSRQCQNASAFPAGRQTLRYHDNPKLNALKDLLVDINNNGKVIIWAAMLQELDDIEQMLKKQHIGYVRVDGSNTAHIRKWEDRFNNDPQCLVYVAQTSTGIAITLNAAKYTVNYSRSWSSEQRRQALGRNYRIGQKEKTVVYDLCARRSVELQQLVALESKERIAAVTTDRINCALCDQYAKCLQDSISPWDPGCVMTPSAKKEIAKARTV